MNITTLYYRNEEFSDQEKVLGGDDLAVLELDHENKTANLSFFGKVSLIHRKNSERLAQSVCKTGFLLTNGERIGAGYNLIIQSED